MIYHSSNNYILGELLQMASSLIPPKNALNSPDMWRTQA